MPGEDYQSWSVTAANNGNADTSIEWREGQTRSSVNNSSRAEMAAHAKNRNLLNGSIVTGGTADAQTFTSGVGYIAPIPTGLIVKLKIGAALTNTASTTLNMDGIGDTIIKTDIGDNLRGGELVGGCYTDFLFNGTNWVFLYSREYLQDQINGGGGVIIGKQIFAAAGSFTYTPTPGMEACIIECIGGGGGGGCASSSDNVMVGAGGGGSGGYSRKYSDAAGIGASQAVVVGAAGTAATSPGFPGGAGGDTSVGSLCIAKGGSGGAGSLTSFAVGVGGAGGVVGTGDITATGTPGQTGTYTASTGTTIAPGGGMGGTSAFGGGAIGGDALIYGGYTAGGAAGNYGAGGGGSVSHGGAAFASGGAGSAGIIIITEFSGRGVPGRDGADGVPGPAGPTGPSGPGTGDVLRSGTPTAGQIAQWTDGSHIEGVAASTLISGFSTGDAKLTFKTTADTGWVMMNDGSIGNATSGATARANADTLALFTLLYNSILTLPLQTAAGATVGRGVNAATDYAANRRLVLPATLGRALAAGGNGAGLTSRALGTAVGEENHSLTVAELALHSHGLIDPGHNHSLVGLSGAGFPMLTDGGSTGIADTGGPYLLPSGYAYANVSSGFTNISIQNAGSGAGHNTMQPTTFLNVMIKL